MTSLENYLVFPSTVFLLDWKDQEKALQPRESACLLKSVQDHPGLQNSAEAACCIIYQRREGHLESQSGELEQRQSLFFFFPLLSYPDWLPAYIRPPQSLACILKRDGPGQRPWPFGVGPGQSPTWPTNASSPTSCSCWRFSVNSHMSRPMTLWGPVSFQRTAGLHICRGGSYPQRDVGCSAKGKNK